MHIKLTDENKSILLDIIIFMFTILLCGLAYFKYNDQVVKHAQLNTKLDNLQDQYTTQTTLMNQYNSLIDSASSYSTILPSQTTLIEWINQIEIMATISGCTLNTSFETAILTNKGIMIGTQDASVSNQLSTTLTLKGSYQQIVNFINLLNNSYYYTQITSLDFSSDSNAVTVTIGVNLYISKATT